MYIAHGSVTCARSKYYQNAASDTKRRAMSGYPFVDAPREMSQKVLGASAGGCGHMALVFGDCGEDRELGLEIFT